MLPEMVDPFYESTRSIMTRNPNNETPHLRTKHFIFHLNRLLLVVEMRIVFTLTKGDDVQSAAE
jgi:hypothetical protein